MMHRSLMAMSISLMAIAPAIAQQTPLDQLMSRVLNGRKTVTGGAAAPISPSAVSVAPNPDQQAKLATAIVPPKSEVQVARDVAEAKPLITRMLTLTSCGKTDGALNQLNAETLEPVTYDSSYWGSSHAVMTKGRYHDASRCYDVQRVGNWSKPATNALSFTAWYVSPVSGEAGHQDFTLQKMPDRGWLIRSIGLVFTS